MFREMRRKNQQLPREEAEAILKSATSGVLAVLGDGGYPYTVPLSHLYHEGKLYFHCATAGHKLDALRACGKASFCVIQQDQVIPEKYTTCYRSAVAFGTLRVLEDAGEKRAALEALADRYWPEAGAQRRDGYIDEAFDRLLMVEFTVEHLTGKEGVELARQRAAETGGV